MTTEERFKKSIEVIKNYVKIDDLPNNEKLIFYKCFKQANEGDCHGNKPGTFDLKGKAKYNAWNEMKGTSKEDAML